MTEEGKAPAPELPPAPERGGPVARRIGLVLGIALFLLLMLPATTPEWAVR